MYDNRSYLDSNFLIIYLYINRERERAERTNLHFKSPEKRRKGSTWATACTQHSSRPATSRRIMSKKDGTINCNLKMKDKNFQLPLYIFPTCWLPRLDLHGCVVVDFAAVNVRLRIPALTCQDWKLTEADKWTMGLPARMISAGLNLDSTEIKSQDEIKYENSDWRRRSKANEDTQNATPPPIRKTLFTCALQIQICSSPTHSELLGLFGKSKKKTIEFSHCTSQTCLQLIGDLEPWPSSQNFMASQQT